MFFKSAVLSAAALAAVLASANVEAGGVHWSVGVDLPPVGVVVGNAPGYRAAPPVAYAPVPAYAAPVYAPAYPPVYAAPVYRAPAPVYAAPVYAAPEPVYAAPAYSYPVPVYPGRYREAPRYVPAPVYEEAPRWRHEHRSEGPVRLVTPRVLGIPLPPIPVPTGHW